MKIAVAGCGALGSYYGALLGRAGHDVHFLARSDFETLRNRGVTVNSPRGDFQFQPHCARAPAEIGRSDLVLIGLKTTANDQFPSLLPPLAGPDTLVLTLQNGLGNEQQLERLFPATQILGGLCFVCLNRTAPGVIHHLAHGRIILGEHRREPLPRTHELCAAFQQAGIPCRVTDNLERAHWEKLVWNVPFNGLGVAAAAGHGACISGVMPSNPLGPTLATDALLGDPRWETLVRELMNEIIAAGNARGLGLRPGLAEKNLANTRVMGAYRASTLIDFERGQPLELDAIFLEPLRQAREAGVPTPRLAALCRLLTGLNPASR